jgi:hypothetical protein
MDRSPSNNSQRHVDAAVQHIEHGLKHGLGNDSVYKEIDTLRHADTVHNKLDADQFRQQVQQVDKKLHHDGFLPKLHLVLDDKDNARLIPGPLDPGPHQPSAPVNNHGHNHAHESAHVHQHGQQDHHHGLQDHRYHSPGGDHNNASGNRDGSNAPADHAGNRLAAQEAPDNTTAINDAGPGDNPTDNPSPVPIANLPDSQLTLSGAPTITPEKINQILQQYHSPAAGMGQYIYDEGVKHGINPAMALAFYVMESNAGTRGLAVKNHSWGNVRGHGYLGYKPFDNIKDSLDHWYDMMKNKYQGQFHADKLGQIIPHYAPNKDGNNEAAYIGGVGRLVRQWAS